jgi:hypothetical protein
VAFAALFAYVGFVAFTAVVMKSYISWDITLHSTVNVKQHVPPKCWLPFTRLYGVTSQKIELFSVYVGFEVVITVKSTVFWDVMPCGLIEVH